MITEGDYIIFNIKNTKNIKDMQVKLNELKVTEEKKYIALEFAENMLEANMTGNIKINGVYVINVIKGHPDTKIADIRYVIDKAKKMKNAGKTGSISLNDEIRERGGRGLISILYADWDLDVEESEKDFSIIAHKKELTSTH